MTGLGDAAREFEELRRRVEQLEALVRSGRAQQPPRAAYKVSEVARLIGKAPSTVRTMIGDGRIKADDMGGWYAVSAAEVERLSGRAS